MAEAAPAEKPSPSPADWRNTMLPLLEGLPLLPCGAGKSFKAPIDPQSGYPMEGWETAAYTPEQIAGMNGKVLCLGSRMGPDAGGLLAFDLDGASAIAWMQERGCDPATAGSWQIHRTTTTDRLKVIFRVEPSLWQQLQSMFPGKSGRHEHVTLKKNAAAGIKKAEQVELYWSAGQIIVAGAHKESGGLYTWRGSLSTVVDLPILWWQAVLELLGPKPAPAAPATPTPATPTSSLSQSVRVAAAKVAEAGPPPRSREELVRLVSSYPTILADNGQRNEARDLCAGWLCACADSGIEVSEALAIISEHHPEAADTFEQVERWDFAGFGVESFIAACREAGVDVSRHDLGQKRGPGRPRKEGSTTASEKKPKEKTPAEKLAESKENRQCRRENSSTGHRLRILERFARFMVRREKNTLRKLVFARTVAAKLKIRTATKDAELVELLMEARDQQKGHRYRGINAAERKLMQVPDPTFVIPGCLPEQEVTVLGGRPKVGKTRLGIDLVRAVLRNEDFLGFGAPTEKRTVILVTDDQSTNDTKQMLTAHGLWEHSRLITSERFRATERDLDQLQADIAAHPGALVVIDSLRSITRSLSITENDALFGNVLLDLKDAVIEAGGTLVLIHHCNKTNGGLVGVEALSGHNSIAGNANGVITLHYLENEAGKPMKSVPDRRLVVEGRSSPPADLVVTSTGSRYSRVCTFEEMSEKREKLREEEQQQASFNRMSAEGTVLLEELINRHRDGKGGLPLLELLKRMKKVDKGATSKRDLVGSEATAYRRVDRLLKKMQEGGIVESAEEATPMGPTRSVWRITDFGMEKAAEALGL